MLNKVKMISMLNRNKHKNDNIQINSNKLPPSKEKIVIRIGSPVEKEQNKFRSTFTSREKLQPGQSFLKSELGRSSKFLEYSKFNTQKSKSKTEFNSKGSPHVFYRNNRQRQSDHRKAAGIEFSGRFFNDLNKVLNDNEGYHPDFYQSKCHFEKPTRSYSHVKFKTNPSVPSKKIVHKIPTDIVIPSEVSCDETKNVNHDFKCHSVSNTLHESFKSDTSSITFKTDTKKQDSSFCSQYKSTIVNYKRKSSEEKMSLDALQKYNRTREETLSIDKNKVVLGQEKSRAIKLMNEEKFIESHDIFWSVLQKEKKIMSHYANSTIHLEMAESYFYIGLLLDKMCNPKISLVHLNESLAIRQKHLEKNDLSIAWTLYYLGLIKGKIGDFRGAISDLDVCSSIQKSNGVELMNSSKLVKEYNRLLKTALAA